MIYVYTGNGKGKTTAAIGVAIRAVGAGKRVFMIQFLKPGNSSEIKIIKKIRNFKVKSFGREGFFLPANVLKKQPELKKMGVKPFEEKDFELTRRAFLLIKKLATEKKCDVLILDEINLAMNYRLLNIEEVINFLKKFRDKIDIFLTGRYCPKKVIKIADLVTNFCEEKHYYKKGIKARKGIDF